MEGLEDGELPSSPDELQDNLDIEQAGASAHPIYTPIHHRPHYRVGVGGGRGGVAARGLGRGPTR